MAGEKFPPGYMERLVRRAHEHDMRGVIIRLAEEVKKTGFSLSDPAITREIMIGIHRAAAKSGFKGEAYERAARDARQITSLLEKREHCGDGKSFKPGDGDMRYDLTVLGVILELRAADPNHTIHTTWSGFESIPKLVARIRMLRLQRGLLETVSSRQDEQDLARVRFKMENLLPLWIGTKFALGVEEVRSSGLEDGLIELRDVLARSIEDARRVVEAASEGRTLRCLEMYNDVKEF